MELKDWATIIVTVLTAVIGFMVTFNKLKKEFQYTIKAYLYQDIKKLYRELYVSLNKIALNPMLVFDDNYINELAEFKPDIYLFSSKDTKDCYKKFGDYVFDFNKKYKDYKSKINYESYDYDDDGNIIGQNFGDYEVEEYYSNLHDYQEEKCPSSEDLKQKVDEILDKLKKELNTL